MKLRLITIGQPKLSYARQGWKEYLERLQHFHSIKTVHLSDKRANDSSAILRAAEKSYTVVLDVDGKQFSSQEMAGFLEKRVREGRELSFIIGGPEGLPKEVREAADFQWSLSELTFPHDLAMVVLLEALYRASTINTNHPYHK